MKAIKEILEDTLDVLKYISETTPHYKKYRKKIEKMLKIYNEDPELFLEKYIDASLDPHMLEEVDDE